MKHKLIATLSCLVLSCALYAQNGWFPPVTFPNNSQMCDNTPWKLVLFDDFNGTQLDNTKWIDHKSWNGMPGGSDNENYEDARKLGDHTITISPNVVVSNGTCKLLVKHEPVEWHCASCTQQPGDSKYISGGMIATYYHRNNQAYFFNSGRFETRMKMPDFPNSHITVWTWYGSGWQDTFGGSNEIDITETFGKGNSWVDPDLLDKYDNPFYADPRYGQNHYFLHGWGPSEKANPPLPNRYEIKEDNHMNYSYPNQTFWHSFWNRYFDITAWHIYACEWDTASVKIFYDGQLLNTIWKYSRRGWRPFRFWNYPVTIGSGCNASGTYNITYGYPYNSTSSECNFRITADIGVAGSPAYTSTLLGQAEIDYVKIWQRHLSGGHTNICPDNTYPTPVINGSVKICPISSFTLSPAVTGTWSVSNTDKLYISNASSSGVTLSKQAGESFNGEHLTFSYGNGIPGCPTKSVQVNGLYCNVSTNWDIMQPTVLDNNGDIRFHFISELYYKRDITDGTTPIVEWALAVNPGQDYYDERTAQVFNLKGQYASTPAFPAGGNESYNLRWTMKVTDASGSHSRSGERNSKTALYQQAGDSNTYYVNAYIDDQRRYDTAVYYGVTNQMVSEAEFADTLFMDEMIEKVRANELAPYLITDGMETFMGKNGSGLDKPNEEGGVAGIKSNLKVYPNPIKSDITIIADARFIDKQAITIHVYDLAGKLIKTGNLNYSKGNIMTYDLSDIADGNYILELQQGHVNEHIKIIKAKN